MNAVPLPAETEQLAKDLLERTRAETSQADNKAAILLAGVLAVAGGAAAALGASRWSPIHQPWYIAVPFWSATLAMLAAITCLAGAVYPRSRSRAPHRPAIVGYFGDVMALSEPGELHDLLSRPGTGLIDVWVDQIWQMSIIISRKYRLVRWSVRLLGVALALAIVVVAVAAAVGR